MENGEEDERFDGEIDVEAGGEKGTDDGGDGMGRDVHHRLQLLWRHLLARHVLDQLLVRHPFLFTSLNDKRK